tara:strand:- start:322 stop:1371 length:1050 start_codon:yes stop_codon:yes gene_type:complete
MKKYYSIEFLRFLSSLSVLIYHYRHFFNPLNILSNSNYETSKNTLPFFDFFEPFYDYGIYGVHVFYAISGFVFAHVYLGTRKNTSFKEFSINRLARLYPLHFATLIIVCFVQFLFLINYGKFQFDLINDFYHFFLQVFFISSWGFENGHSFNAPIWSVSIEIGIYLLFFVLIGFIQKYKLKLIIFLNIFLIVIDKTGVIQSLFLECARLFFSGVLVYYIVINKYKSLILFFISLSFLAISFIGNFKTFIFCPALILFFLSFEKIIVKDKIKNYFITLGNWTYALYLSHVPIQLLIIFILDKCCNLSNTFNNNLFFFFYFISLFFLSHLIFNYFEKPLNKKIREFYLNKK